MPLPADAGPPKTGLGTPMDELGVPLTAGRGFDAGRPMFASLLGPLAVRGALGALRMLPGPASLSQLSGGTMRLVGTGALV